jgi:hypothetical protein
LCVCLHSCLLSFVCVRARVCVCALCAWQQVGSALLEAAQACMVEAGMKRMKLQVRNLSSPTRLCHISVCIDISQF